MDILGGLAILFMIAGFAVWQMSDALALLEAKIHARRVGLRAQRESFGAHLAQLRSER